MTRSNDHLNSFDPHARSFDQIREGIAIDEPVRARADLQAMLSEARTALPLEDFIAFVREIANWLPSDKIDDLIAFLDGRSASVQNDRYARTDQR